MTGLVGKYCKVFFDDMGKVLCKEGLVLEESLIFVQIKVNGIVQAIPTNRVVRVEVLK